MREGQKIMNMLKDDNLNKLTFSEISLRLFNLSDIDDFMLWASDDRVSRFCRWDTCTSKEDALHYMKTHVLPHQFYRAICFRNRPIGAIFVEPFTGNENCRGQLGYALTFEYWGRGFATIAVKMVVAEIFRDWKHLERLEGLVIVENVGSQRVLEKVGFTKEGVLRKYYVLKGRSRDFIVYSLLNTDPKLDY